MKITETNIEFIKSKNGLIGFASIVIDNALFLSSIAIHKKLTDDGYRLTYPTKQKADKNFNIYYPINKEASKEIENAVFAKLKEVMNKANKNDRYNSIND
ncbi:MAG: hypothetical protein GY817_09385 [bacterium]|nr:hypothetical protein [bacterium]